MPQMRLGCSTQPSWGDTVRLAAMRTGHFVIVHVPVGIWLPEHHLHETCMSVNQHGSQGTHPKSYLLMQSQDSPLTVTCQMQPLSIAKLKRWDLHSICWWTSSPLFCSLRCSNLVFCLAIFWAKCPPAFGTMQSLCKSQIC